MEAKRALCMLRCCPLPAWLSKGCRPFQSSQGIHLCDQGWPQTCQNAKAQSACKATRGVVSPLQRPACGSAATTRGDHSPRASPAMSAHDLPPLPEKVQTALSHSQAKSIRAITPRAVASADASS